MNAIHHWLENLIFFFLFSYYGRVIELKCLILQVYGSIQTAFTPISGSLKQMVCLCTIVAHL